MITIWYFLLLYVNMKNATILISMVTIYVYQCHIHNGPWPQPIAPSSSLRQRSLLSAPAQTSLGRRRWASGTAWDVRCVKHGAPDPDISRDGWCWIINLWIWKSFFLDNMDEFTLWIQTYPEMVNHRVNHQLRTSSINIWSSYAGWWLSHPSEKYESQLGLFFPIQHMEK